MLEKYTKVYVENQEGEWTIVAVWALDSYQRNEAHATYGYEVCRGEIVRIVYDTQVKKKVSYKDN